MKKENIILWSASFIIVFLSIYIANLIDEDYPVTSTFGIEGRKVSYRFEKVHYGIENYEVLIRTDVAQLSGNLFWKSETDTNWQSQKLEKLDIILLGSIPALKPEERVHYYVELNYNNKKYVLPDNQKVTLKFFGKIPIVIDVLEFLLLYLGIILIVRSGLEYFNNGKNSKKFGVLAAIAFLILISLVNPLYLTYKFGFINSSIPPINRLFLWSDLTIFLLWVGTLITIFRSEKFTFLPLVSAILTLIIFILFR